MAKSTKTVSRRSVTRAKAGRSAARTETKAKPKTKTPLKIAAAKPKRAGKPAPAKRMKAAPAPKRIAAASAKASTKASTAKRAAEPAAIKGKWVYTFGGGKGEGGAKMKNLLGGKGANLAEMANLALPVPPGFTITTEVCTYFYQNNQTYPKDLKQQVEKALDFVGKVMGKKFGDPNDPLLMSVRSGARASMPGMMDTVLNLGLNDETVEALARISGDRRFAFDSYRRFINMYSNVVLDIGHHNFEEILDAYKERPRLQARHRSRREGLGEHRRALQEAGRARAREIVSAGSLRAAVGLGRRRVRLMDEPARDHLSQTAQLPEGGAPPSTCRRWCSAISARRRRPASRSAAIRRPATTVSTASS